MGTLTGQNIIDRAWIKANDSGSGGGVRWPTAECLMWINDGQREIVNLLPSSNPKTVTATLQSGPRQTLSGLSLADGVAVIDIPRIVGANAITKRDRAWFDDNRPAWPTETGTVYHWMYDDRDPAAFYVWKASAGATIELVYGALPTDLATAGTVISLSDIYANALQWFVLFSFYSKDAQYTKSPQLAESYWNKFLQSLGFRGNAIKVTDEIGDKAAVGV